MRFDMRGKTLRFTIDMSAVDCMCSGYVSLVHMARTPLLLSAAFAAG